MNNKKNEIQHPVYRSLFEELVERGIIAEEQLETIGELLQEIESESNHLLGEIALENGFITYDQLRKSLEILGEAQEMGVEVRIGEVLVNQEFIDQKDLQTLLHIQRSRRENDTDSTIDSEHTKTDSSDLLPLSKERHFLNQLINEDILSVSDIPDVLDVYFQQRTRRADAEKIGQIGVRNDLLSKQQLQEALQIQDQLQEWGFDKPIGEIFVEKGFISQSTLEDLLDFQEQQRGGHPQNLQTKPDQVSSPETPTSDQKDLFLVKILDKKGCDGDEILQETKDLQKRAKNEFGLNLSLLEILYYSGEFTKKNLINFQKFMKKQESSLSFAFPIDIKHEQLKRSTFSQLARKKEVITEEEKENLQRYEKQISNFPLDIPTGVIAYKEGFIDAEDLAKIDERETVRKPDKLSLDDFEPVKSPSEQTKKSYEKEQNKSSRKMFLGVIIFLLFAGFIAINYFDFQKEPSKQDQLQNDRVSTTTSPSDQQNQKSKTSAEPDSSDQRDQEEQPEKKSSVPTNEIQLQQFGGNRFYFRGSGKLPFLPARKKLNAVLSTNGQIFHETSHKIEITNQKTFQFSFGPYYIPGKKPAQSSSGQTLPPGIYTVQMTIPEVSPPLPDTVRLAMERQNKIPPSVLSPFLNGKNWKLYYLHYLGEDHSIHQFHRQWIQFFTETRDELKSELGPWRDMILQHYRRWIRKKESPGSQFSPQKLPAKKTTFKNIFKTLKTICQRKLQVLKNKENKYKILPYRKNRRALRNLLKLLPLRMVEATWQFYQTLGIRVPSWIRDKMGGGGLNRNLKQFINEVWNKIETITATLPEQSDEVSVQLLTRNFYRRRAWNVLHLQQFMKSLLSSSVSSTFPHLDKGNFGRLEVLYTHFHRFIKLYEITFRSLPSPYKSLRTPLINLTKRIHLNINKKLQNVINNQEVSPPTFLQNNEFDSNSVPSLSDLQQRLDVEDLSKRPKCRICADNPE